MITAYTRGHLIKYIDSEWIYADDKSNAKLERPCVGCGKMPTPEGYDTCIGYVKDAESVCCGHGISDPILLWKEE